MEVKIVTRFIFIASLLIAFNNVSSANLTSIVFNYECKHVNPKEKGFTCSLDDLADGAHMHITFVTAPSKLSKSEQERISYNANAFILRYFQLGGRTFEFRYKYKPKKRQVCSSYKNNRLSYVCNY